MGSSVQEASNLISQMSQTLLFAFEQPNFYLPEVLLHSVHSILPTNTDKFISKFK
jgi:hypothetical protein